jgi:hypothetical protein
MRISDSGFWENDQGERPEVGTVITSDDYLQHRWQPINSDGKVILSILYDVIYVYLSYIIMIIETS